MKKFEHLAHFNIAGFAYYQGVTCFNKLKVGNKLELRLETENKYDPRAVAIYYQDTKLGFVPRSENRIIYKLLFMGLGNFLETRIQMVAPNEHPENQISVVIHIVNEDKSVL